MSNSIRLLKTITIILSVLLIASTVLLYENSEKISSQNQTINKLTSLSESQKEKITQLGLTISNFEIKLSALEINLSTTQASLKNETQTRQRLEKEILNLTMVSKSDYGVLAVDENDRGHVIELEVVVKEGKSNLFINVGNVVVDETLQSSAQTAIHVARDVTKTSLINKDILINIKSEEPGQNLIISGGSAGAAMTLAAMAAMQGKTLRKDVLITGTINFDHTIGRIGAVRAKALAAKEKGAVLFLVPQEQKREVGEIGIEVREVKTIEDAARYAFSSS
ncbi:MAG: S16 family serine protease [Candidatus Methanoperedens sp.]|nr:S16 family serine protease [Candidatus Methanoperedens sp.]